MRLGIFLALVASAAALQCNIGNYIVESGIITSKTLESKECYGACSRTILPNGQSYVVFLACQENEISIFVKEKERQLSCSASDLEQDHCLCKDDFCSDFKAEENLVVKQVADVTASGDTIGPKCYVGYYVSNITTNIPTVAAGDTVYCGPYMACVSLNSAIMGYDVNAYFCTPQKICDSLLNTETQCGNVTAEQGTVTGCCCTDADCLKLANKVQPPPSPTVVNDTQIISCYSGAYLNYAPLSGGAVTKCAGSCSYFSLRTTFGTGNNAKQHMLDIYTCDPVELCSALSLKNGCGNLAVAGSKSVIRSCCCDKDNCIDPTAKPPVYPVKQLKCYTGIYVPATNYSIGAEQYCDGQCGRVEVAIGTTLVKYMMCAPYTTCQGFGIAQADQCYNPPLEEENKVCCCSSFDNCNIDKQDRKNIPVNPLVVPTNNYPILCYGGIHLNGVPISNGAYSLCSGECATASFVTTVFNQAHNTTIYTCDPANVCKAAGISNKCDTIGGIQGLTACCCDQDVCFDPNRKNFDGKLTCFTGIYIPQDNFLSGGEMLCDGWCGSLSSKVSNKTTYTYWCAPVPFCRKFALGMGGDNNCNTIQGTDNSLQGCCCSEKNNCNIPDSIMNNVTAIPARVEPPIVCYEGLWVNGAPITRGRYRVCDGECASVFLADATPNGTINNAMLYTCEPSGSCATLGLRNNCSMIDGSVTACCCSSDACIDPNVNRSPGTQLTCYVGVQTPWNNTISVGAEVNCNGRCANLTSTVNNQPFTSYHCMPTSICNGFGLSNSCNSLNLDRNIQGCCCDNGNNCNVNSQINTTTPVVKPTSPIACYQGIKVNGVFSIGSSWQACRGECMSITLNTTYANTSYIASVYSCDPSSVCGSLGITNRCHDIEPNTVRGCCCPDSGCIDPTITPEKKPHGRGLMCYVGVMSSFNNFSAGTESVCYGSCASLTTTLGNATVTAFACVNTDLCNSIGLYDSCGPIPLDKSINACCCNNHDQCNIDNFNIAPSKPVHGHDFPTVCYSGLYVNGNNIGGGSWQACAGDCVSITVNNTFNSKFYMAEFYTCDPSLICHQLNVINNCTNLENGFGACCCDSDACLDPTRFPPKKPGNPLKCYVGLKTDNLSIGSEVYCNGMCSSIFGKIGNPRANVTAFMCSPTRVCKNLEIDDSFKPLPYDPTLKAMCCDNYDNCNVFDKSINVTKPVPKIVEYPISCYSGVQVNGQWVSDGGYQVCNGECAMLTLNSTYNNNVSVVASIYSCDPTAVCRGLGVINTCKKIQDGLQGCCCNTNGCIDPTKTPPKLPGNQLTCYVGLSVPAVNISVGAAVACDGKCFSIYGIVGQQQVTTYHCVDRSICRSLEIDDICRPFDSAREITACCCDNENYCNNKYAPHPPLPTNIEYPITCWSGLYVNGNQYTTGKWDACQGDCVSISLNTTIANKNHTATLYTCDPSQICNALNTSNTCHQIEDGVQTCCCNTDACLNPTSGRKPGNQLMCYVGVKTPTLNTGAVVPCSGKCALLSGTVNGTKIETFHCADNNICRSLELFNECQPLPGDKEISGCCCDSRNNCNLDYTDSKIVPPAPANFTEPPIVCHTGLLVNGKYLAPARYTPCQGDCAVVQINTTIANVQHSASIFTCDPSRVCQALNTSNTCNMLATGVKGCCCNTDVCIDPVRHRYPDKPLTCYVGIYAKSNNFSVGAEINCDGMCASLETHYQDNLVKSYHCVSRSVCSGLGIDNSCNSVTTDREIKGCCCDNANNCNAVNEPVLANASLPSSADKSVVCWSGLYLNMKPLSKPGATICNGDCAVIQYNTTAVGNQTHSLTLYTCDPVTVCTTLNLKNTCGTLDGVTGLTGCCCDSNICVDDTSIYPKNTKSTMVLNSFNAVLLALVYMMLRW